MRVYDYESLKALVVAAGFGEVSRSEYNTSPMPELRIDSVRRRDESLYVEAVA